jgi:hypothetical protein
MKSRLLDLLLLIALVVGGFLAWQTGRERSRLSHRYDMLVRKAGNSPVSDPSKVCIRAIDTGEPLHFAWHIYFPPNYTQTLQTSAGGGMTSWGASSSEFIGRVRFREDEQGDLRVYTHFGGGSGMMSFGNAGLAKLIRGRGRKIRVEQVGAEGPVTLDPSQSAVMLRLSLPEDMQAEARELLAPHDQKRFIPVLFELDLGTPASNP